MSLRCEGCLEALKKTVEGVPVSLGLFDDADGLVQVTGKDIDPGEKVVVPAL